MSTFKCDLCLDSFKEQFAFFEHLKQHYDADTSITTEPSGDTTDSKQNADSKGTSDDGSEKPFSSEQQNPTTSSSDPTSEQEDPLSNLIQETDTSKNATNRVSNSVDDNEEVANRIASIIERIAENVRASAALSSYTATTSTSTSNPNPCSSLISTLMEREEDIFIQTKKVQYECPGCSRIFKREKKFSAHVAICCTTEDLNAAAEEIGRNQSSKIVEETESAGLFANQEDFINSSTIANDGDDEIIGPDLMDNEDDVVTNELLQKINKQVQFLSNVTCILCDTSFQSKSKLDTHLRKSHPEFSIARTQKKKKGSGQNEQLSATDQNAQKKAEVLKCTECERIFNHRNSLVYHMRSHTGERPHQCDSCGKSFFATSALKVHMRLHTGDKPFKCEQCGRYFRQWGDLKYHIISIHSSIRSYQCEFCGKDFARKYSLIVHRRIHTGERNYKCEYCGKSFRAASYLQNHRRIHTGEKPHSCMICSKPFRVRSDMKRHMASHNRESTHPSLRSSQTEQTAEAESLLDSSQVPNVITLNGFAPNQIVTIGSQQLSIGEGDTIQLMLDGPITVDQARRLAIDVRNHGGTIAGEINESTPVITLASADGQSADGTIETVPSVSVQSGELSDVVMYSTGEGTVATSRENNTVYVWPVFMNSV